MALFYTSGFNLSLVNFSLTFSIPDKDPIIIKYSGSGEANTYYLVDYDSNASELYGHVDFHAMIKRDVGYPYASTWSDATLASIIHEAFDAGIAGEGWGGGGTVSFSQVTYHYIISRTPPTDVLTMTFGNAATRNLLGFADVDHNSAWSYVSEYLPTYALEASLDHLSKVSDEYEPGKVSSLAVSDGGSMIGMARTTAVIYMDWTQQFEPITRTFIRKAEAAHAWTYQHLFEHCRTIYPVMVSTADYYTGYKPVYILRADGAAFKPLRDHPDYDGHWHIPFKAILCGWL